jgi:type I restriction enzyme, S subunit
MTRYLRYPEYVRSRWFEGDDVPSGWAMRRLKFVASYNDESLPETTSPDLDIVYVDISSVDLVNGIKTIERLTFEDAPSRARRIVMDGDTIVSTVRPYLKAIASVKNPPRNLIVSTGFAVVRPLSLINSRFLGYALQSSRFIDSVVANSTGVSYPAINPSALVGIAVSYPEDRDEQKHIADFLDHKTTQLDQLIVKKRELIEKLNEQRVAIITQAVTKGLDPTAPMRDSGVNWLGQVPQHWRVPALKMRYTVELGKMLDEKKITGECLVSYLRNSDVQWDFINYEDLPLMDICEEEYPRYTVRENDILVCEGGEVGRTAIVTNLPGVIGFQKALHRMRPEKETEVPRFLFYTLFWAANTRVFEVEGASTIAHLTGEQLRRYSFPQPPPLEQKAIADFLDAETDKIRQMISIVESAIDRLNEYRGALITAASTGKIDVRNIKLRNTQ